MSGQIDIGIIGAGNITSTVHLPIISCIPGVKAKYVADIRDPSRVSWQYGAAGITIGADLGILPECDAVLLAVPVGARADYMREFSSRKTPILSEKPFAVNLKSHLDYLKSAGKVSCNYMRTCYSNTVQAGLIISSSVFGELESALVSEGGIVSRTGKEMGHYQMNPLLSGGGILMERGCHSLSQIVQIFDGHKFEVEHASAVYQNGLDVDVDAEISVSGKNNLDLEYRLSLIKPVENISRFTFEKAEVSFNHTVPDSPIEVRPRGKRAAFKFQPGTSWAMSSTQAFFLKWKNFLDSVRGLSEINPEKETSLDTTRIIEGIYRTSGRR